MDILQAADAEAWVEAGGPQGEYALTTVAAFLSVQMSLEVPFLAESQKAIPQGPADHTHRPRTTNDLECSTAKSTSWDLNSCAF